MVAQALGNPLPVPPARGRAIILKPCSPQMGRTANHFLQYVSYSTLVLCRPREAEGGRKRARSEGGWGCLVVGVGVGLGVGTWRLGVGVGGAVWSEVSVGSGE